MIAVEYEYESTHISQPLKSKKSLNNPHILSFFMRRRAYPYGRFLLKDKSVGEMGPKLRDYVEDLACSIVKYDENNEGRGTLIIAVNKKIRELMKQKKPSGHLTMILSGFAIPSFRETDYESQRAGLEFYLWPIDEGVLLEIFVLPYMEHLNKYEIFGFTESEEEEIADWYLCEQIWEHVVPQIVDEFDLELVHRRG
jgi:hypothetical protein